MRPALSSSASAPGRGVYKQKTWRRGSKLTPTVCNLSHSMDPASWGCCYKFSHGTSDGVQVDGLETGGRGRQQMLTSSNFSVRQDHSSSRQLYSSHDDLHARSSELRLAEMMCLDAVCILAALE